MPKYLLTFEKGEPVRWLGHLDILRTFERAVRRAALPIAFSNGFNPRAKLVFASALSTGVTGQTEPALIELTEPIPEEKVAADLNEVLPAGIRIVTCTAIDDAGSKDVLNTYDRAEYTVVCTMPPEVEPYTVGCAVTDLLASEQITITREREGRVKTVDVRPNLFALALLPEIGPSSRISLTMVVGLGEGAIAKPAEVIGALAEHVPGLAVRRIHRVRLFASKLT